MQSVLQIRGVHHHHLAAGTRQFPRGFLCEASKGFGDQTPAEPKAKAKSKSKSKKPPPRLSADQAVERAVRIADGGTARAVNAEEAAKGRLDYVQVKDWGSGTPDDLGSLEVKSFASGAAVPDDGRPFYEQLARYLEQCQARGELDPPKGSKRLPPFERWSFKKRHFVQFLTDQITVHYALEAATLAALQPGQAGVRGAAEGGGAQQEIDMEQLGPAYNTPACRALHRFTAESGLPRSGCIAEDLNQMARHTQGDQPETLRGSKHAENYAENIIAIAAAAQDEASGVQERDAARLRLLAHLYSAHVAHLTTGMRIGAKAVEKLDLFSISATNMYERYPEAISDPLHAFMGHINATGEELTSAEKEIIFAEVAGAFRNASLLLAALARTD